MTHPRECSICARVLDHIEMQHMHLETLIACTALNHDQLRARQREIGEIREIIEGKGLEARWTMSSRARARMNKEKA